MPWCLNLLDVVEDRVVIDLLAARHLSDVLLDRVWRPVDVALQRGFPGPSVAAPKELMHDVRVPSLIERVSRVRSLQVQRGAAGLDSHHDHVRPLAVACEFVEQRLESLVLPCNTSQSMPSDFRNSAVRSI